jgi:hypothetical protein
MSRYPRVQLCSSTHHLTPLAADDGSEVQPMQNPCIVLTGQPRSCRPNQGGKVARTSSAETHGCSHINKQAACMKSPVALKSPSRALHSGLTADRVNGVRKSRFTVSFTDPFTSKTILSLTEHTSCAKQNDGFGRGQNTGLGWSDPTFGQMLMAKRPGVAPAQHAHRVRVFCPRGFSEERQFTCVL